MDDLPGVTRDRNFADCTYQGRAFQLMDTGGLDLSASEGMTALIQHQSKNAIAEADILLIIMDGREGLTVLDHEIVQLLRGVNKPIFFAINKIDSPKSEPLLADFFQLSQENLYPISAEQGLGVDDLLEALLPLLPVQDSEALETSYPRIAVVGRPNTGKSTLINTILGEDRVLVSQVSGTTRDPIDTIIPYNRKHYVFTDTAGIRRRGRIERGVEGYSVARTHRALGRSDIAILMLDAEEGITEQDTKIAGLITKQGRGCIMIINKWDLRQDEPDAQSIFSHMLSRQFPFFMFVPTVFGSALQKTTAKKLFTQIDRVMISFSQRIPTSQLNKFLQMVIAKNPLTMKKGNPIKSVFMTQVATRPPTFALFVGRSVEVKSAYRKYLENHLRKMFGFEGAPIRILVREK